MRFALVDSGLGVLPAAMHLRRLCPGAEMVLSMDPEGMPWGPRTPDDIAGRALACAQATLPWEPDVLVLACNTGSVRALDVLRAELEPAVPVVGTVPAIKPAAAARHRIAIWATAATTGSPYQHDLIRQFADGVPVTEVACPGLADAIERADQGAIDAAVAAAAAGTPPDTRAVVLGCTHYELVVDRIHAVLSRVLLHGSAPAVAAQAIRRHAALQAGSQADSAPAGHPGQPGHPGRPGQSDQPGQPGQPGHPGQLDPAAAGDPQPAEGPGSSAGWTGGGMQCAEAGSPSLLVLLSGSPGGLPEAALSYAEGRLLAGRRLPSTTV